MKKALPVICLMGPTASGKTNLAVALAESLPLDLISVDSAMVYRGMEIGTAKPTPAEQKIAPHALIDICDPKDHYSAGQFYTDAVREIENSHAKGRIPLLVGGTLLYFYVLQHGFSALPARDFTYRAALQLKAEKLGWPALHVELQAIDPLAASHIHPHDAQRIQRALEVYYITKQPISTVQTSQRLTPLSFTFMNMVLAPADRHQLHDRIAGRWRNMLAQGFIEEVKYLYARSDLHRDLPSIRTVGYRQVWDYLAGTITASTMEETALAATRQLAKRQLTWLRRFHAMWLLQTEAPFVEAMTYLKPVADRTYGC